MEGEIDVRGYLKTFWRRRYYVLAGLIVTMAGAVGFLLLKTPVYQAEAVLQVNAAVVRPEQIDPFSGLFLSREAVKSIVELIKTPRILGQVAGNLELASKGQTLGEVSTAQIGGTEFFKISARNTDPVTARKVANEVAGLIIQEKESEWAHRAATVATGLTIQAELLKQKIQSTREAMTRSSTEDKQLLALELSQYEIQYGKTLREMQDSRGVTSQLPKVLILQAPAVTPGGPIDASSRVVLLGGLILGLMAGAGAALVREFFSNKISTPEDVQRILGVPVMAALPDISKQQGSPEASPMNFGPSEPVLEPYHLLRTTLQAASRLSEGPQSVLVTSGDIGEGKSTTTAFLGMAQAASGRKTILIDADMRRPRLHELFGVPRANGLSDLLSGDIRETGDCIRETPMANLSLITAGSSIANTSVLLGSDRMQAVLQEAKETASVVLVDSPPILYSSGSIEIMTTINHVLIVIMSGMLKTEALNRVREVLGLVTESPVDAVLNKVGPDVDPYAYYSYYYYQQRSGQEA